MDNNMTVKTLRALRKPQTTGKTAVKYKVAECFIHIQQDQSPHPDEVAGLVEVMFPDGHLMFATPPHDIESVAKARALGYQGNDAQASWKERQEHILAHHLLAAELGDPYSLGEYGWATRRVNRERDAWEDQIVHLLQFVSNVGIQGAVNACN